LDNKSITRKTAVELLNLQKTKVHEVLASLVDNNLIVRKGQGRSTYYTLAK
jgi:ATP-dependent DNA helicase RecG